MSRHFLRVCPNEQRPEEIIEHSDHVYAILIDRSPSHQSRRRSEFALARWIKRFNELAEGRVGLQTFAPSIAVVCSEVDDEELDRLDSVGAVVIEKSQLCEGEESFAALFANLLPDIGRRRHLQVGLSAAAADQLDDETIKFLEDESEGITDDDRRELLDILGSE